MPDSPARYIPGYLALSSPKSSQPIELNWSLDGSTGLIRLLPSTSTPRREKHRTTSCFPFIHDQNSTDNANHPLFLVEHANRAEIHQRQKRIESELSEALRGDIEWVRSGGVLRDCNGRRDFARTEWIRGQIDEQERERKALSAWAEYEDRWRASLSINGGRRKDSSSDPMEDGNRDEGTGFRGVAWPVAKTPKDPEELTFGAVQEFVLAPLRGKSITPSEKKARVRQLLLRYHPDKTGVLLSQVNGEDKDRVREGINNVFMSLKALQEDPELQPQGSR